MTTSYHMHYNHKLITSVSPSTLTCHSIHFQILPRSLLDHDLHKSANGPLNSKSAVTKRNVTDVVHTAVSVTYIVARQIVPVASTAYVAKLIKREYASSYVDVIAFNRNADMLVRVSTGTVEESLRRRNPLSLPRDLLHANLLPQNLLHASLLHPKLLPRNQPPQNLEYLKD